MSLIYAKITPEKIHSEYSQAITRMGAQQIPHLLTSKPSGIEGAFLDLGAQIAKSLDTCKDSDKSKRLRALKSRLAKLKMDLIKNL